MKNYVLLCSFIVSILSYGCASNQFIEREDNPDCKTVITGSLIETPVWNSYYPSMVLKNGYLKRAISFQMKEEGVDFVEKKPGIFSSIDTVFYPFSEVTAIIDSNSNCIYGKIPKVFRLEDLKVRINLIYLQDSTYAPVYIDLLPDETFSYCLRPGTYVAEDMIFKHEEGYDKSVDIPYIKFVIHPDIINNIGTFSITRVLKPEPTNSENITYIPYKIGSRNSSSAFIANFGLIGGIAAAASSASNIYSDGYYKIEVKYGEQ